MASVRSLDNALETNWATAPAVDMQKITKDDGSTIIPDNGRILRNIIHGADTVMSHITHFYHLAALDFVDVAYLGAPFSPTYSTTAGTLSDHTGCPTAHT
jgi:Ni,Fe-hydrogenase I large subunit